MNPASTANVCSICNGTPLISLHFKFEGSMRSDGLCLGAPLKKFHCMSCGAALGEDASIQHPYHRSAGDSAFDLKRHGEISTGLVEIFSSAPVAIGAGAEVLEIGAGGFQTASLLKRLCPWLSVNALERHPESDVVPQGVTVIVDDFFEWVSDKRFDVCYSNNVIEHTTDPVSFLRKQRDLIRSQGFIVVCCPVHFPVSSEILFADHLFTFSPESMYRCGEKAGLQLICSYVARWDSLTKVYIFCNGISAEVESSDDRRSTYEKIYQLRQDYLDQWAEQRDRLSNRLADITDLWVFGAGEFAQLVRCYFPGAWGKVRGIIVDDLSGARSFEKPLTRLASSDLDGKDLLVAVKKGSQTEVVNKLMARGVPSHKIILLSL